MADARSENRKLTKQPKTHRNPETNKQPTGTSTRQQPHQSRGPRSARREQGLWRRPGRKYFSPARISKSAIPDARPGILAEPGRTRGPGIPEAQWTWSTGKPGPGRSPGIPGTPVDPGIPGAPVCPRNSGTLPRAEGDLYQSPCRTTRTTDGTPQGTFDPALWEAKLRPVVNSPCHCAKKRAQRRPRQKARHIVKPLP